jgi:cytochrome d ubiquinol oxidase subunit II
MAAVTFYAIFGGADFGAGFWDLTAGGADRGKRPREIVDHSIGPVWEANHVWLIFVFVLLWTCFPEAYASILLTMFVPLTIAAFGIVLRGASFAFRKAVFRVRAQRHFGAIFAISSVLVPYCFGAVAGGIASGRVPAGGQAGDPWNSWVNPTSIVIGVLAVCVAAYVAAVFLTWDAGRPSDDTMVAYFRIRAVVAGVVAGVVAVVGLFVVRSDAKYIFVGLTSRALPLVVVSAIAGLVALVLLRGRPRRGRVAPWLQPGARPWMGVAQWDYLLPETLTVSQAGAPAGTITAVLVAAVLAAVLIVPAFALLYILHQKSLLPEEGSRGGGPTSQTYRVRLTSRSAHAPPILRHRVDPLSRRTRTAMVPTNDGRAAGQVGQAWTQGDGVRGHLTRHRTTAATVGVAGLRFAAYGSSVLQQDPDRHKGRVAADRDSGWWTGGTMTQEQTPALKGRFERWFEVEVVQPITDFRIPSRSGGACSPNCSGPSSWCWSPPVEG